MIEFDHVIKDELGIHARPAGLLVKTAGKFNSDISISVNGKIGDAKRLFSLMGLGVKQNDNISVQIRGDDEENASVELKEFLKNNL